MRRAPVKLAAAISAAAALLLLALSAGAQGLQTPRLELLRQAQMAALPTALAGLAGLDLARAEFVKPVAGVLSSLFGWRNVAVNGNRYHGGVDFAASPGTAVAAARDGVVTRAGWWGTYGYAVALDHGDGSETRYAHLSRLHVAPGAVVRQGDLIGAVGSTGASTGPHLHFELRFDGRAVDPLLYLAGPVEQAAR